MIKFVIKQFDVLRHTDEVYLSVEGMWDTFIAVRMFDRREEALKFVGEKMPSGMYQIVEIVVIIRD